MSKQHHTKNKGDIGVLKAQCALAEQGYTILLPMTEHSAYDIVAEKDGIFKRVQVKYKSKSKDGAIRVALRSSWADRHGTHTVRTDKNSIDIYAVYCPDTDDVYFFDPEDFGSVVSLRVDTPKNNQRAGIKSADDYRRVP